jgi:hypothetical protein
MANYGTERIVLQDTTGAIQSDDGAPLLSTQSEGGGSYALGPTLSAGIYSGIQNGNFASPPPSIGTATPISDDNSMPYFSFVDGSSGRISAAFVEDSGQASGYAVRFTIIGGLVGDTAYLERIVSMPSSRAQAVSYQPRSSWTAASSATTYSAFTDAIYLKADGTTTTGATGTAARTGAAIAAYTSTAYEIQANPNLTSAVPIDAAFLRVRTGLTVGTAIPGTATIDLVEIRLDNGRTQAIITDSETPTQYGYGVLSMTTGQLYLSPNEAGTVGANPRAVFNAQNGQITLDASKRGTGGAVVSDGSIRLAHDITNGKVWFGGDNSTRYEDTNLYRNDASVLRTDDRLVVGNRTNASTNQVDAQGVILDAPAGFAWVDRSPNSSATDASLFLSSGFFNGNLQMVRFLRKITTGGTVLTGTGHILVANNATTAPSFGAGSDWRLKSDVRDASDEINFVEKINDLRPVLYTETGSGDKDLLGFIAHEVQAVIPNAVEGVKDAVDAEGDPVYQMLYPAKFIPYLVGAVRELTARVEQLEAKVAHLESEA